jgi:hypothetical protein
MDYAARYKIGPGSSRLQEQNTADFLLSATYKVSVERQLRPPDDIVLQRLIELHEIRAVTGDADKEVAVVVGVLLAGRSVS